MDLDEDENEGLESKKNSPFWMILLQWPVHFMSSRVLCGK